MRKRRRARAHTKTPGLGEQDDVEKVLLLRGRRVRLRRFGQATRSLHLGEKHRQFGENLARNERRNAARRGGEFFAHLTKFSILSNEEISFQWHPVRPIIASISSGVVSIWAQNQVENWSAFAPDFKELDENVEYEERESEFDLSDEDKSVIQGEEAQDEEVEVDVSVIDRVAAFCSSDEETEDIGSLQFLPIAPEVEDVEDNQALPHEPPVKKHRSHSVQLQGAPIDGISHQDQYKIYNATLRLITEIHPLLNKGKDKPAAKKGRPRLEHRKGK